MNSSNNRIVLDDELDKVLDPKQSVFADINNTLAMQR